MSDTTDDEILTESADESEPEPVAEAEPVAEPEPKPVADTRDEGSGVMLLGAGELSRELALAFQRLGADVIAVDGYYAPAHGVANRSAVVKMTDAGELAALITRENPRYVVAESGSVAADALISVAEHGVEVFPTPRSTRLGLDRESLRRLASDELGLPTAPFWFAGSAEELASIAEHAGYPLVVKPVSGQRAEGQSVLLRADDVEPAWRRAIAAGRIGHNRVIAETVVEVDYEVTLLTVRTTGPQGPALHFCEPIGHREVDGGILESWQPQAMSPAALDAAKSVAARIVNSLGGRGVFGVELLVRDDEVYFTDVRSRPYDNGLVTLRSQRLSEFELHARAILGLPVDTIMVSPGAAEVSYGTADTPEVGADVASVLAEALSQPESDVRVFGRPDESDAQRRLGVALATAPDVTIARERARQASTALRKLW